MKRFTIFAAILLFATTSIFAQSEKTVIIKENKDGEEKVTVVERWFHNNKMVGALPDLYYSYLNLRDGAFGPEANIPLRSSSFEWGIYSVEPIFCTPGHHFGISSGFGISNAYNYFSHDIVLRVDADRDAYFQSLNAYSSEEGNGPTNNYAHRSFLRYWSLRVPVMLQLQWQIQNTPMALAAGAEVELRFGVRSFARYGGAKHKVTDNLDYNPWGVNALFSLNFDNSIIFFRMNLTEMFKVKDMVTPDTNIGLYQMAIGFGFKFD